MQTIVWWTALGATVFYVAAMSAYLFVFAANKPQLEWECRPYPGYCDIDTDSTEWRKSK